MTMQTSAPAVSLEQPQATTKLALLGQNLSAMLFGALVLFAVGFLPMDVAHNAAHDSRHALAFPCH